jgi:hypothetical protein
MELDLGRAEALMGTLNILSMQVAMNTCLTNPCTLEGFIGMIPAE